MEINTQELEVIKKDVNAVALVANQISIVDDASMLTAGELRKKLKTVGKMVEEKKQAITRPLNEALKNVRAMFSPIEDMYAQAESIVSGKMIKYQNDVEEKRRKAELKAQEELLKAQKDLDKGKIDEVQATKIETRVEKKLEAVPEAIKKSEDFHTREVQKFRIVNEAKIPKDYWMLDEVKIRKAMMAGIAIAGVEYYKDKIIV